MHLIYQFSHYLDSADLASLTHASVTLWLNYYNVLHLELPLKTTHRPQPVQNETALLLLLRLVTRTYVAHFEMATLAASVFPGSIQIGHDL